METNNIEKILTDKSAYPLEIEKAIKIQEALKPLGYEIYGFKKKNFDTIVLHLTPIQLSVRV
jgi:hypothetical protein